MEAQYEIELALMAGRAYQSTRMDINWLPVPDGWTEMQHKEGDSGFEAVSFFNGPDVVHSTEIVISYAGTNPNSLLDPDNAANIGLATGFGSEQLLQAAEYYLQVKALNPEVHITLTGHSLGGGLAALVGVFFGVQATTFDQAPFANSAEQNLLTPDVAANLKNDLLLKGYSETDLVGLTNFLQLREANGGIPNSNLISNIRVDGEFLSSAPLSAFDTIGTPATVLNHGPYSDPSIDMHSMALLTVFLQSEQSATSSDNPQQTLSEVTKKLTNLLEMLFDGSLYAYPTSDLKYVNLLEHLVQHQEGFDPAIPNDGDAMVGRFTTDMWKIAQDGGLSLTNANISKMLTAFAMQKYYEEPASGDDHGETLFSDVTGGIRFNRAYVADTFDADSVKGYKYFLDYVGSLSFGSNRDVFDAELPNLLDWYIQAGSQAMEASAGDERAFMLGGRGDDILIGSSQADLLVGNSGQDTLYGGAGDDVLMVGWTPGGMLDSTGDALYGGIGSDRLYGGNGADTLDGGADADLMIGGGGIDTYYIEGADTIVDSGSNFIVYDGQILAGGFVQVEGTTNVYRSISNDQFTLTFNSPGHMVLNGTDSITFEQQTSAADFENGDFGITLYDQVETDLTWFGTDLDTSMAVTLTPDNELEYLRFFENGIERLHVDFNSYFSQNFHIDGNVGNDLLFGLAGQDDISGGIGDDRISGDGSVRDFDWTNQGAGDVLYGNEGNDFIIGGWGDDLISGGDDGDFLLGDIGKDTVAGDAGDDLALGGTGDDQLFGGAGNDMLCGDGYILWNLEEYMDDIPLPSTLSFNMTYDADGFALNYSFNYQIWDASIEYGDDLLLGGDGNDWLNGGRGNDTLLGEADHDRLEGGDGDDLLAGGDGNDLLFGDVSADGADGNDTLSGGTGDDELHGHGGNDILEGGSGNDYLYGGVGNDTYLFSRGAGQDFIYDTDGTTDTIRFFDVAPSEVIIARSQLDLSFAVNGTADSLLVQGWFAGDSSKIERVEFGDGTVWDAAILQSMIPVVAATDQGGELGGTAGNDIMDGGTGEDYLRGGTGNDLLEGGTGNDLLVGDDGADVYSFSRGFGQDIVYETHSDDSVDTIFFAQGIAPTDIVVTQNNDNLYLAVKGTGDLLTLAGWANALSTNWSSSVNGTWIPTVELNPDTFLAQNSYRAVEQVKFSDGTAWNASYLATLAQAASPAGTYLNDTLGGGSGDDTLFGFAGNDRLYGSYGNDFLDGGDDYDNLAGGIGNDILMGGRGDDWLDGWEGDDFLDGGDGDDWFMSGWGGNDTLMGGRGNDMLAGGIGDDFLDGGDDNDTVCGEYGDDTLMGGSGDDCLDGSRGNDWLDGGKGNDVFFFGRGYGQDRVYSWDENVSFTDVVRFNYDVKPTDVIVSQATDGSYDLVLSIIGTDDTLTISGFFDPDYGRNMQIDRVEFSNGTVWNAGRLTFMAAEAAKDVVITGTTGDDILTCTAANDTLQGGAGNDLLAGGDGNDTYIFNPGDGVDRIVDSSGTDTILFGEGITPDSLSLGLGSLLVRVGDQGDAIHLEDFNPDDPFNSSVIEQFQFADGTVLGIGDLLQRGFDIHGTNEDDLLTGTAITDRITGGEGNDTLAGGKGDDLLAGGGGNDTYVFNLGDGQDTIEDISSSTEGNLIAFGAGITASDLAFVRDDADLLIQVGSQGDTLRLKDFDRFGSNGSLVADTLQFADNSQASLFALTNSIPVVGVMPDNQTALEDAAYSFTIPADTFTDLDAGDSLTYSATLGNGNPLPSWLTFDPATQTFSGMPTNGDVGMLDVTVMATDTAGASAIASFGLNIANVNDAPLVAAQIPAQSAIEDAAFSFTIPAEAFTDVDAGDALTYSATLADASALPAWLSFDAATRTLSGTSENEDVGILDITVTATDSTGASVAETFALEVINTNDAPMAMADAGFVGEDNTLLYSGNVLINDSDVDAGTILSIAAPGEYIGRYGTLTIGADGGYTYSLDNGSGEVQALAQGSTVVDQFTYDVSDGIVTVPGNLDITVTGANDAPVLAGDSAFLIEDLLVSASGNGLVNDTDVDSGTTLTVADPSTQLGSYGTLSLAADGGYTYSLDNMSDAVQSLGREAVVAEHFSYTATDGIVSVASALDITLAGSNDAPLLIAPLADQQVKFNKNFSWQMPTGSFVDPDQGDTLDYSATLADGSPLPSWLSFDAATQTFSGRAPRQLGSVEVKVTATDKVAAIGSTEGSLATSDVFLITVSHENSGEDNCNDAPGAPGRHRGYNGHRSDDRDDDRSRVSDKARKDGDDHEAWRQPQREQPAYLNASHWNNDMQTPEKEKHGKQVDPSVVFGRWLTMDLAVSRALAEKKTLSWLDERLGADTTALGKASTGFLDSAPPFGSDLFSLQAGHGQELKGFKGLGEGLRKVA